MSKQILAAFDAEGVYVYQAFHPALVESALVLGTFGRGFNRDRMTWIKPSFGWMLYRSGYATKHRQERILKIKLRHDGFRAILGRAVPTTFNARLFSSHELWRSALDRCEVRVQWDPDRDLSLYKLDRRAIQLGLSGQTVRQYVDEWIVGLEDVTALAHAVRDAVSEGREMPIIQEEKIYPVESDLAMRLGMADAMQLG